MSNATSRSADPPSKPPLWQRVLALYRQQPLLYGFGTLLVVTLLLAWLSSLSSTGGASSRGRQNDKDLRDSQVRFVANSLGRLDEYDARRYTEMLRDNLNQWISQLELSGVWPVDPFVLTRVLPPYRQRWRLDSAQRQQLRFTLEDARWIQGAVWMRDISGSVRRRLAAAQGGGIVDPLSLATGLLDWTIRNVTLQEGDAPVPELAWETVLWGRGPADSRAWVFIELCRQQGLEVALLAYRDPEDPGSDKEPKYRPWIPAVLIPQGKQSTFYLFDHTLGLPVPGPGGKGVATLKQAIQQPDVLRQLDVGVRKYLVESSHLKRGLMAGVFPSPFLLSRRMQLLESELHGPNRVILTAYLSSVAARFDKALREATGADKTDPSLGTQVWDWPGLCLDQYRGRQQLYAQQELFDPHLFPFPFGVPGFEQKGGKNEKLDREHRETLKALAQQRPFLFSVPIGPESELNAGQVPAPLRQAFQDAGRPLPQRVSVSLVEDGRQWQIQAVRTRYAVRRAGDVLNVYGQPPEEQLAQTTLASVQRRQQQEPVPGFLWRGRMLQFQGRYRDARGDASAGEARERGAPNVYQSGRISELELDQIKRDLEADSKKLQDSAREAARRNAPPEIVERLRNGAAELEREIVGFPAYRSQRQFVRALATYWLGIVSYERGDNAQAIEYFRHVRDSELPIFEETVKIERQLAEERFKGVDPKRRPVGMVEFWSKVLAAGAWYNLARSLEASGQIAEAIDLYEQDSSPDSRHGSLLRARRLREQLERTKEKAAREAAKTEKRKQ